MWALFRIRILKQRRLIQHSYELNHFLAIFVAYSGKLLKLMICVKLYQFSIRLTLHKHDSSAYNILRKHNVL